MEIFVTLLILGGIFAFIRYRRSKRGDVGSVVPSPGIHPKPPIKESPVQEVR